MVSLISQLLYPRGKSTQYTLHPYPGIQRRLGGSQCRFGPVWILWRKVSLVPVGNRTLAPQSSILTELSQLHRCFERLKRRGHSLDYSHTHRLFVSPWRIRLSGLFPFRITFEIMNLIDSWYDSMDGGSGRHKAATYTGEHKHRTEADIFKPKIWVFWRAIYTHLSSQRKKVS
jgi:hypothetical protein